MEDFNIKKAKQQLLEGEEFKPIQLSSEDLERIKFMFQKLPINQDLRDVLGFDKVYQNSISVQDNKIIISVLAKSRK
jgi:hypothetical protein